MGLLSKAGKIARVAKKAADTQKSALRKVFDELPESEKAELPSQPDDGSLIGYHGTAKERSADEPFFDIDFARKQDQFMGEGFYFTIDPNIASEYANVRAFKDFDIEGSDGKGGSLLRKRDSGVLTSTSKLLEGLDIDDNPIAMNQSISRFDLSGLEKPYVVKNNKERLYLKDNIEKIKKQGYDSVLFAEFGDRSKQIMVFPEHMDKIDTTEMARVKKATPKISNIEYQTKMSEFDTIEDISKWQTAVKNYVKTSREVNPDIKTPELENSTRKLLEDSITREEHLKNIDKFKPVTSWNDLPREPSGKAVVFSLRKNQREDGVFALPSDEISKYNVSASELKVGDTFNGRLDIDAYKSYDSWIVAGKSSTANKGSTHYLKAVHYEGTANKPVKFLASQKTSERIGTGEIGKTGYATISGTVKDLNTNNIRVNAAEFLNNPEWTQVGFDPRRQGGFFVRAGENKHVPVREASEVIQIGPLVLAKNVVLDLAHKGYYKGGAVKLDSGGLLPSSLTPKRSIMAMNPILKHHYENIATGNAVENEDGSLSTVKTAIVEIDGKETLIPTVWNGEILEGNRLKEAIDNAVNSGVKWPSIDAENVKAIERLNNLDKLLHQDMEPISKEEAQKVLVKEFSKRRNIDNGIQRLYDTTKTEDEINFNTFKDEPEIQEKDFGQGLKNKIPKWLKGFDPLGDKKSLTVGFDFNKGGTPMMEKQMEMFEDGGLKDQGGTVDPISGNDVPIGSTKKEVRDDIPAQLSEGEFVFPADVVRYIGLEKLMNLRQQAKMGLKRMEQMGQMGNSDEATMPDDMPFGMADLIVVSPEGKEVEMAEGGVVQAATGVDVQPTTRPLVTSAMNTGTRPNVPTFQDVLGQASIELKQYQNKEGATLMVPHMGGIPIYEVPAGYFEVNADGTPVRPEDVPTGDIEKPAETQVVPRPDQEYGGDVDFIGMVPGSVGSAASSIAATSSMADLMTGKREPSMLEKMYIGSKPQIAMTNRQLSAAGVQITGNPKQDLLALTLYNSINEGKRSGIIPNSEEDIKNKKDIIDLKTMYVPESTRIANQQMTTSKPITQDEIAKSQTEQAMINRENVFGDIPSVTPTVTTNVPSSDIIADQTRMQQGQIGGLPSVTPTVTTNVPSSDIIADQTRMQQGQIGGLPSVSVADKINLLTSEGVQAIDQPTFNELVSNVEPGYVPFQIGEKTFERPSMGFDATTDFGPPKGEPAKAAELYEKVLESPLNRRARRDLKSLGLEAKEEARAKTAEEFAQAEAKRAEDEQIAAQKQLEQLMAEDASKEASTANDGTSSAAASGAGGSGAIDPDASPGIMNKGGLAAKKPKKKPTRKYKKGGLAASKK